MSYTNELKKGVHYGIKPAVYHSFGGDSVVSKSKLWAFAPNPARWREAPPFAGNVATVWGNLVDCLLLTPALFEEEYAVQPTSYSNAPAEGSYILTTEFEGEWKPATKACKEWKKEREAEGLEVLTPAKLEEAKAEKPWNANSNTCKAWLAEQYNAGKTTISEDIASEAWKAVKKVQANATAAAILDRAETQVALVAEAGTLTVKALLDVVPAREGAFSDALCDLKTFRGWAPDDFTKQVGNLGYHAQAAFYLDMWNLLNPDDQRERWLFILSESAPPYTAGVLELHPDAIEAGREWYKRALTDYENCVLSGHWPSPYDSGILEIDLKPWDYKRSYDNA